MEKKIFQIGFPFRKYFVGNNHNIDCVANLYAVWPVYEVKCLYSQYIPEGGNEGRRGPLPLAFQYLNLMI